MLIPIIHHNRSILTHPISLILCATAEVSSFVYLLWLQARSISQPFLCLGQAATWHSLEQYWVVIHLLLLQTERDTRSFSWLQLPHRPIFGVVFLASKCNFFKHLHAVRLRKNFKASRISLLTLRWKILLGKFCASSKLIVDWAIDNTCLISTSLLFSITADLSLC